VGFLTRHFTLKRTTTATLQITTSSPFFIILLSLWTSCNICSWNSSAECILRKCCVGYWNTKWELVAPFTWKAPVYWLPEHSSDRRFNLPVLIPTLTNVIPLTRDSVAMTKNSSYASSVLSEHSSQRCFGNFGTDARLNMVLFYFAVKMLQITLRSTIRTTGLLWNKWIEASNVCRFCSPFWDF
jgi:hypothetical protein